MRGRGRPLRPPCGRRDRTASPVERRPRRSSKLVSRGAYSHRRRPASDGSARRLPRDSSLARSQCRGPAAPPATRLSHARGRNRRAARYLNPSVPRRALTGARATAQVYWTPTYPLAPSHGGVPDRCPGRRGQPTRAPARLSAWTPGRDAGRGRPLSRPAGVRTLRLRPLCEQFRHMISIPLTQARVLNRCSSVQPSRSFDRPPHRFTWNRVRTAAAGGAVAETALGTAPSA